MKRTAPILGTWHLYKIASVAVWRIAGSAVFGPFFHELFPNAAFSASPRLAVVSRILTLFRLAYPSVRDDLLQLVKERRGKASLQHAKNLLFLMEWMIPKVRAGQGMYISISDHQHDNIIIDHSRTRALM